MLVGLEAGATATRQTVAQSPGPAILNLLAPAESAGNR